jgi:hypothetical protein
MAVLQFLLSAITSSIWDGCTSVPAVGNYKLYLGWLYFSSCSQQLQDNGRA